MKNLWHRGHAMTLGAVGVSVVLSACGGSDGENIAQLSPATASTMPAGNCVALSGFTHANTSITAASVVAAGTLTNAGQAVGAHCLVTGSMHTRTSTVDGQTYAIKFEIRLPVNWNGRFLHQGNGGTDGSVVTADGGASIGSGGLLQNGLQMGFAVISSDAGHTGAQNPLFGVDPQARLNYGYQAVGSLTPMAKALITSAYGRGPDRSYFAGTSNGGRHAMVAAARYPTDYDGFLAVAPGFNLPKAAVAQLYGAQQWNAVTPAAGSSNTTWDLEVAFSASERQLVANAIRTKCDGLDGATDGLVQDVNACRTAFNLATDVPTCAASRDTYAAPPPAGTAAAPASCISAAQKTAIANVFAGARNTAGTALYSRFPYDPGLATPGWASWKFQNSVRNGRDPVAVAHIFSVPPVTTALSNTLAYALNFNFDTDAPKIFATNTTYTESAMSLMTPPNVTNLETMRARGGKMIVVHGLADGVFSADDTAAWYDALDQRLGAGSAAKATRLFLVPGMGHSRGGPSTDQFDALTALVSWVENGTAPERIVATARTAGNPGGANADVSALGWAAISRPLCPYPKVARYVSGDTTLASSFTCAQ